VSLENYVKTLEVFYNNTKLKESIKRYNMLELEHSNDKNGNNLIFDLLSKEEACENSNCENITIATTCMNRIDFLKKSLITWLELPFKKIIIVDWSSDENVKDCLVDDLFFDERIEVHRVEEQQFYEHSKARNYKMSLCEGWVLSIDCDVMLSPMFAKHLVLNESCFYRAISNTVDKSLKGTSLFTKELYDKVGGANEILHGWGSEDIDLYNRMKEIATEKDIHYLNMKHIEHDDELRVKHTRYINLCNLFNSKGVNCTFYGPHDYHLDKCRSKKINELTLCHDDILIYHFLDILNERPPVKKLILSLHEK
jgi:predicted glycosyltransferase involved in capsule biosynthesis